MEARRATGWKNYVLVVKPLLRMSEHRLRSQVHPEAPFGVEGSDGRRQCAAVPQGTLCPDGHINHCSRSVETASSLRAGVGPPLLCDLSMISPLATRSASTLEMRMILVLHL